MERFGTVLPQIHTHIYTYTDTGGNYCKPADNSTRICQLTSQHSSQSQNLSDSTTLQARCGCVEHRGGEMKISKLLSHMFKLVEQVVLQLSIFGFFREGLHIHILLKRWDANFWKRLLLQIWGLPSSVWRYHHYSCYQTFCWKKNKYRDKYVRIGIYSWNSSMENAKNVKF